MRELKGNIHRAIILFSLAFFIFGWIKIMVGALILGCVIMAFEIINNARLKDMERKNKEMLGNEP